MSNATPLLQPIRPAYHLRILSDGQLAELKTGTLNILTDIGIHCPSEKALKIYAEHGANVDFETQIVKLSSDVVLEALSHAPRTYTMGARSHEHNVMLDGTALYCGTDGCGVEVIDFATRQRRSSIKGDVAKMARVADYLSSIGFYWPMVSAQDFPKTSPLHEIEASLNNTVKHVQSETLMGERIARHAIEMARVIAGDNERMRATPPLSLLVCCIAPLAQDKEGLESALAFAEVGLPVGFMSMATAGSTAPTTLAGTVVTGNAEVVSAMVLIQMAFPGAPTFYSLIPGIMHPRTGGFLGSAWESTLLYPIGVELAHHWGVPALAGVYGTDAPVPGWQSAGDTTSSLMLCALTGAETGNGLGLVESCMLLYPEALLLDSDIYHRVRIEAAGLDTSPMAQALDIIRKVGPRGHFLGERHTRDNMRQHVFSDISAKPSASGSLRDPIEVAREKVNWILENHEPQPLESSQQNELTRILAAADKELA